MPGSPDAETERKWIAERYHAPSRIPPISPWIFLLSAAYEEV